LESEGHLKISDFGASAIKSDNVDELLKCHGTVDGPIQFMAPEMELGELYDFKSDIYNGFNKKYFFYYTILLK